jgi:hypothetical protein
MGIKAIVGSALLVSASNVLALTIDFETVPGSASADQLPISNQYQTQFGVTFSLNNGSTPFLEAVGTADAGDGFINDNLGVADTAAPGFANQLKNFYLRIGTATLSSAPLPTLIINYSTPVAAASAEIWDIDAQGVGTEQWLLQTLDGSNNVNDSLISPLGTNNGAGSLDGKPWAWSFSHGTNDIYAIRVSFIGSKTNGIGLAFDNFSPSSVSPIPEPTETLMLLCGLAVLGISKLRKRPSAQAKHVK